MPKQNLSQFKKVVRRLLKKHNKSQLAKTLRSRSRTVSKKGKGKKSKRLKSYRSKMNNNNVNGGAVRDGSPQQFLKC